MDKFRLDSARTLGSIGFTIVLFFFKGIFLLFYSSIGTKLFTDS